MNKIFITGASGFVGTHLINELKKRNLNYVAGSRTLYGDMAHQKNWENFILGCDTVIHLAARVHVMNESNSDPLTEFRKQNVEATFNLAKAAKHTGVKRFIYLSSVKVNGEETYEKPFFSSDEPAPEDAYGISKMEAESELLKMHEPGKFEIVIIRPPLVYGPGVKANFEKLFYFVSRDLPMPFGMVKNKRSLVSVFNLVDLIIATVKHPNAGGEIFMVSDDHDLSLRELIDLMAKVQGKTAHLLPVPVSLMKLGAKILGKKSYADRLFGNLQVDIEKTKKVLDWKPPCTFEDTFRINS
jgi:UDP-glucose 4-epimerase